MSETVIKVENLGKKYIIGHQVEGRSKYVALRDVIANGAKSLVKNLRQPPRQKKSSRYEEFWALKDISFAVKQGEVIGIIGRNGAGKSTLLKLLSRITEPTAGRIKIKGRVASLLEVGTGFHPELTGRENIYLNGAILGMSRLEIKKKFDEIVSFAEVEKFLDTPVKRYSSGMYVRLAFAVAAHLEPEILIVDEVLAVGDAAFQKKCLGKMGDVAKQQGRTVLFVSHNMGAVTRLCQRAIWLKQGKLVANDQVEQVVSQYLTDDTAEGKCVWQAGIANPGIEEFKIFSVAVLNQAGEVSTNIDVRQPFCLNIQYKIYRQLPFCRVGFLLSTYDGITVFETYDSDHAEFAGVREPGCYSFNCQVPANLLNTGQYILSVNVGMPTVKNLVFLEGVLTINIEKTEAMGSFISSKRGGVILPKLAWQCLDYSRRDLS